MDPCALHRLALTESELPFDLFAGTWIDPNRVTASVALRAPLALPRPVKNWKKQGFCILLPDMQPLFSSATENSEERLARQHKPAAIGIGRAYFFESETARQKFGDRAWHVNYTSRVVRKT